MAGQRTITILYTHGVEIPKSTVYDHFHLSISRIREIFVVKIWSCLQDSVLYKVLSFSRDSTAYELNLDVNSCVYVDVVL